jgi:hypothetical protein
MTDIYNQLRYTELNPELAAKLYPFINAYRPHDQPPTWQELKASGLEKIEEDSLMDIIADQYEAEKEAESEEECAAFRTFA